MRKHDFKVTKPKHHNSCCSVLFPSASPVTIRHWYEKVEPVNCNRRSMIIDLWLQLYSMCSMIIDNCYILLWLHCQYTIFIFTPTSNNRGGMVDLTNKHGSSPVSFPVCKANQEWLHTVNNECYHERANNKFKHFRVQQADWVGDHKWRITVGYCCQGCHVPTVVVLNDAKDFTFCKFQLSHKSNPLQWTVSITQVVSSVFLFCLQTSVCFQPVFLSEIKLEPLPKGHLVFGLSDCGFHQPHTDIVSEAKGRKQELKWQGITETRRVGIVIYPYQPCQTKWENVFTHRNLCILHLIQSSLILFV